MMVDLKTYKKVWHEQEHKEQLDSDTLSKMIHRRSSSIVKWIFYISIIEFVILTLINVFVKTDWEELKDLGLYHFIIGISILSYIIPLIFIYLFYKNYKSISVIDNTKGLIQSILKTRRTVKNYILTILALFAFAILYGFRVALQAPEYENIIQKFGENGQLIAWGIVVFFVLIVLGIILLIYLLIYGILLKHLN
jgi:hypothetical protein